MTVFALVVWFLIGMLLWELGWGGRIAVALVVAVSLFLPRVVGGEAQVIAGAIAYVLRTGLAVFYLIRRKYIAATW